MLEDKEIDISYTQFTFTLSRAEAVDFSVPFRVDVAKLFIPRTGASTGSLSAYFTDFGMDFWISLIVSLSVMASLFFFLNFHERLHRVIKLNL